MATTKAKRHTHKYHKVSSGSSKLWACARPDCIHYMPPNMTNMVEGKYSICWECNEEFILDPTNMTLDRPICGKCAGHVNDDAVEELLRKRLV